jgi:hypothetical protein
MGDNEFATMCLNPGRDPAPRNPLCPVCEEQIQPITNGVERRFVCGCDQIWMFTFEPADSETTEQECPACGIVSCSSTSYDRPEYYCENDDCRVYRFFGGDDE